MINLISQVESMQATCQPQEKAFWAYQSVIDMLNNIKSKQDPDDHKREAIRLIEHFTSYGIDISPERRREYAVFSALQHVNELTTPQMDIEKLVFYISVAGEISKRTKNPNIK